MNIDQDPERFSQFRRDYHLGNLDESEVNPNPYLQFKKWFEEAAQTQPIEPNAVAIATSTLDGKPSVRMVLMKGLDESGLVFFTNYESRKGQEVMVNPRAAALFYWDVLQREARIEGVIARISEQESDAYFVSRPRDAQIGAWASKQSTVIPSRAFLEEEVKRYQTNFGDGVIARPPFWGGYRLTPDGFEFWQGRPNRLHDRLYYSLQEDRTWSLQRLSP